MSLPRGPSPARAPLFPPCCPPCPGRTPKAPSLLCLSFPLSPLSPPGDRTARGAGATGGAGVSTVQEAALTGSQPFDSLPSHISDIPCLSLSPPSASAPLRSSWKIGYSQLGSVLSQTQIPGSHWGGKRICLPLGWISADPHLGSFCRQSCSHEKQNQRGHLSVIQVQPRLLPRPLLPLRVGILVLPGLSQR